MSTIITQHGNLLDADAEALVNTVNCVGIMGKGIALQFKKAFPQNFKDYANQCKTGKMRPGRMFIHDDSTLERNLLIINFPTKQHWRNNSKLEYISDGLDDLAKEICVRKIKSIAMPPLGCGNGNLSWNTVKPIIVQKLGNLPGVKIIIFEPKYIPDKRPPLTRIMAATYKAATYYENIRAEKKLTHNVIQRLMYLFEIGNGIGSLRFEKQPDGLFSKVLVSVLHKMNGFLISGFNEQSSAPIRINESEKSNVESFFHKNGDLITRFKLLCSLIRGFDSPQDIALLACVHWVCLHENANSIENAAAKIRAWNPLKKDISAHDIETAYSRLESQGWLNPK